MSKRQWMFFVGALLLIRNLSLNAKRQQMIDLFNAFRDHRPLSPEFPSWDAAWAWAEQYMNGLIPDPNMSPKEMRVAAKIARSEALRVNQDVSTTPIEEIAS